MGSVARQRFREGIRGIRTPTGREDTLQGRQGIHDHPPGALGERPAGGSAGDGSDYRTQGGGEEVRREGCRC
jgi:hypothetical protein